MLLIDHNYTERCTTVTIDGRLPADMTEQEQDLVFYSIGWDAPNYPVPATVLDVIIHPSGCIAVLECDCVTWYR